MALSLNEKLEHLRRNDPDGWETREPTQLDHLAFVQWAERIYGPAVLMAYWGTWDEGDKQADTEPDYSCEICGAPYGH